MKGDARRSEKLRARLLRALERRVAGKQRRAEHADRDLWVAIDFHTRSGRHREKRVAADWGALKLTPRRVASIASRYGRRAEFKEVLRSVDLDGLRSTVQWHRARLTRPEGWGPHVEVLRYLQLPRPS